MWHAGQHLVDINENLRSLHAAGKISLLSFTEGTPLAVMGFIPKVFIVPFQSAYPGFGLVYNLVDLDHIHVCKPTNRDDANYVLLLRFLRRILQAEKKHSEESKAFARLQHNEAVGVETGAPTEGLSAVPWTPSAQDPFHVFSDWTYVITLHLTCFDGDTILWWQHCLWKH